MDLTENRDINWGLLSEKAWLARKNAYVIGGTAVGAAVITADGTIFTGCNVEHRYRIQDIHAEVNAITNMVNSGYTSMRAIFVAAERKRFTPCGSCLDWIIQFGGLDCLIGYQTGADDPIIVHLARELMPYYPE